MQTLLFSTLHGQKLHLLHGHRIIIQLVTFSLMSLEKCTIELHTIADC